MFHNTNHPVLRNSVSILLFVIVLGCFAFLMNQQAAASNSPEPDKETQIRGTSGAARLGNSKPPLNMVKVQAGKVVLGLSKKDVEEFGEGDPTNMTTLSASMPRHTPRETIPEFFCDITEVTNAQWKAYLDVTGQQPSDDLRKLSWGRGPDNGSSYPENQANFPIRNVSYYEAREFARWCGKRLPTELEWMRAASGDDGRRYAWGDEWNRKLCQNKRNTMVPVGSYPDGASPFGIMDMTASVWEWTCSPFRPYDKYKPITLKIGREKKVLRPEWDDRYYVIKSGHYHLGDVPNMLAIRDKLAPSNNMDSVGFRCIKSPEPGSDIFQHAMFDLKSKYLVDKKWDNRNFYAIEIAESDTKKVLITNYDHFVIAPLGQQLISISKIMKESQEEYFPLGLISISRPLEEPNLPQGAYTIVYRHKDKKAVAPPVAVTEEPAEEEKKEETKKEGEEPAEEETEAEKRARLEEEEKARREAEEERKEKEAAKAADEKAARELEKIGALHTTKDDINFPKDKNLILFLNASDAVVGYLEIEKFGEDSIGAIRIVHVAESGMTEIEFSAQVVGSKHPRFKIPIKIRNNPFK